MKTTIIRSFFALLLTLSLSLTLVTPAQAQCPMCRMTAESNLANGGQEGRGLNNGILYMLATPYLLIGAIGYAWYRNRKKFDGSEEEQGA
jgi:hypothetical protein